MTGDQQIQRMIDKYVVFSDDTITLKHNSPLWAKRCFKQLKQNLGIYKSERKRDNGTSTAEQCSHL